MSITHVQNAPQYDASLYNSLIETARSKNVDAAFVDAALLDALHAGKDFQTAVGQVKADLPTLPPPLVPTMTSLGEWVGMPSPGALYASVIIQEAARQRAGNREIIRADGDRIASLMEEQADKIEKGAMQKFACAVAGAAVNMAAGAVSLGVAVGGVKTDAGGKLHMTEKGAMKSNAEAATRLVDANQGKSFSPEQVRKVNSISQASVQVDPQVTASVAQSLSTIISSAGSVIGAGGDYAQAVQQAEAKRLEALEQQVRTSQELTKQTNEAMRDLIAKALDFMNSMQANMNQTRTKILG